MSEIKNDLYLRALKQQPVERTPVWVMRQAGRYLPEYRATREKAGSFLKLCKTPELACEVTIQPIDRFNLDASIIFSDILTIPDAMGQGLEFRENEGPVFEKVIRNKNDLESLEPADPYEKLSYVADAIKLVKTELAGKIPLIGFSGSPWTVACYMVEGKTTKTFSNIKRMAYQSPSLMHAVLENLQNSIIEYLSMQIDAGVNAVMLFDTWGGVLAPAQYQEFSLKYMDIITRELKLKYPDIPVTIFTKSGFQYLDSMLETQCDCIGVDWSVNLDTVKAKVGNRKALQGNLDPCVLYADSDVIRDEVKKVLAAFGNGPGHVFNLGHGIYPDVKPESLAVMLEAVREFSSTVEQEEVSVAQ